VTEPVAVSGITSIPSGIIGSSFYGFTGGEYSIVDTLYAGRAYWVKCSVGGKLIITKTE
jgi:hypothetical protein